MTQKYHLLVLDLDGTLTNSKKEISPRNLQTLLRLQQSGVRLVLASGRPTYGIAPLADTLRMKEYGGFILSYNGGEIMGYIMFLDFVIVCRVVRRKSFLRVKSFANQEYSICTRAV